MSTLKVSLGDSALDHVSPCQNHSLTNRQELFIEAFKPLVFDILMYCLLSLRLGGATAAASHSITDSLFLGLMKVPMMDML